MTFRLRNMAAAAVLAAFSMAAACGDGGGSSSIATTTDDDGARSASGASTTAPGSNDDASPAVTASTDAMTAPCQAYLSTLQACLDHATAQNPDAVAPVRETLEDAQSSVSRWSQYPDTQTEYCVSSAGAWDSRKENFGC